MTKGERMLAEIRGRWIGTPMEPQQSCAQAGADCKGLFAGAARDIGLPEAKTIYALKADYQTVDSTLLLEGMTAIFDLITVRNFKLPDETERNRMEALTIPGDMMVIKLKDGYGRMKPQHLAMVSGNGRMIHTLYDCHQKVSEVLIGSAWWSRVHSLWRWRD